MIFPDRNSVRKQIKICGNRFPEDAWRVAAYEPDFMGWIFSPRSPRRIPVDLARRLMRAIRGSHPRIPHVGVFAGNAVPEIRALLRSAPDLDFLQIVDGPGFVAALERDRSPLITGRVRVVSPILPPILPVVRVRHALRDGDLTAWYGDRPFYLMDSYVPGRPGGTGQRFAPELVAGLRRPFLLAGGLNAENVGEAIRATGALGADVSSGIEFPGAPGRKDPALLARFVAAVRAG